MTTAILLPLLLTLSSQGYTSTWTDPLNDMAGMGMDYEPRLDLIQTSVHFEPGFVVVELTFDPATNTSDDVDQLGGYVDFDIDSNAKTGVMSHIDQLAEEPPQPMGVDYYFAIYPLMKMVELTNSIGQTEEFVGFYPAEIKGSTYVVRLPRCPSTDCEGLPLTSRFLMSVFIGNGYGITDRAPNGTKPYMATPDAADFDQDGDVDTQDFDHFRSCVSGPGITVSQDGCSDADFDKDGDVDQDDFGVFQVGMTGTLQ